MTENHPQIEISRQIILKNLAFRNGSTIIRSVINTSSYLMSMFKEFYNKFLAIKKLCCKTFLGNSRIIALCVAVTGDINAINPSGKYSHQLL
jgi:hypothetical protein